MQDGGIGNKCKLIRGTPIHTLRTEFKHRPHFLDKYIMKNLFLDDIRVPADVTWVNIGAGSWDIVRSYNEAVNWVLKNGFPEKISFDHDLADAHYYGNYTQEKTGMDFAKWLVEYDLDTNTMPGDFSFTVHSMNPQGKINIEELLYNYLRFKKNR